MEARPQVLVHVRDYFWKIYNDIFSNFKAYEVTMITDFEGYGVSAVNPDFHRNLRSADLQPTGLDEDMIVRRCRLLRNIPVSDAVRMLRAMHATLLPWFENRRWSVVIGQAVDDYVTHLLCLMAQKRGIPYLGLCSSYFPGYTQVTLGWNGAYALGRTVAPEEAESTLKSVSGARFRQDYNILVRYDLYVHVVRVCRYWFKRLYFGFLRYKRGAPSHIHYIMQPFLGQQKEFLCYPGEGVFHGDWQQRVEQSARKAVYFPLGHTPEAGTDYMIEDSRFIDYEKVVESIARCLAESYVVLVKDHFHMLGIRDLDFYRRLKEIPNVVLIPPGVNSNALLERPLEAVLVGAGSVGIEATIRGKRVFTLSDSIYWLSMSGATYLPLSELNRWPEIFRSQKACLPQPRDFVRSCLGTMLPYDYMIVGADGPSKAHHLEAFLNEFLKRET